MITTERTSGEKARLWQDCRSRIPAARTPESRRGGVVAQTGYAHPWNDQGTIKERTFVILISNAGAEEAVMAPDGSRWLFLLLFLLPSQSLHLCLPSQAIKQSINHLDVWLVHACNDHDDVPVRAREQVRG
jgi:hypothetical protein